MKKIGQGLGQATHPFRIYTRNASHPLHTRTRVTLSRANSTRGEKRGQK